MPMEVAIQRPKRWDEPFGQKMTDADVDRLLTTAPFNRMDPDKFPESTPLRDILQNDTRIARYQSGDIVVREGDYGNSAFLILSGTVRVEIEPEISLPAAVLGRQETKRKGFKEALAQLWKNPRGTEVRPAFYYKGSEQIGSRQDVSGNVRIFLQDVPAILEQYKTVAMESGSFFGETAALGRTPRTATIFADGEAELLEIRWQGLRDIMRRDRELKTHIDEIYRERNLRVHLRETPIFRHLYHPNAPEECNCEKCTSMQEILDKTTFETYGDFDWHTSYKKFIEETAAGRVEREPVIATEGHYPNGLIMVRSGFARVSKRFGHGHRTVSYMGLGHHYGFDEIVFNWRNEEQIPLQHSIRAVGYTAVLIVPTSIIEKYVLGDDSNNPLVSKDILPSSILEPGTGEETEPKADLAERVGEDVLEFLVERRFINGTKTMVIDLDRCVRCDDCVRACAATHNNNPRFIRHGSKIGHHQIANACMHCEDPVCMIGCPTGAIHRDPFEGEVVINDVTCIGCGTCANSCPYNNIRMVEVRDQNDNFILDQTTNAPILKATKCDLCIDQMGGPSCERACPHDALVRVDVNQSLESLANWINK